VPKEEVQAYVPLKKREQMERDADTRLPGDTTPLAALSSEVGWLFYLMLVIVVAVG
jgi:hypothetical protein